MSCVHLIIIDGLSKEVLTRILLEVVLDFIMFHIGINLVHFK